MRIADGVLQDSSSAFLLISFFKCGYQLLLFTAANGAQAKNWNIVFPQNRVLHLIAFPLLLIIVISKSIDLNYQCWLMRQAREDQKINMC